MKINSVTYHHRLNTWALSLALILCLPGLLRAYSGCDKQVSAKAKDCEKNKPYLTKEFKVDTPGIFKAYTFAGDIEVTAISDSSNVRVELYLERGYSFWSGSKNLDNYRITMEQKGNEVISSVEKKSKEKSFFSDQVTFSYKVYLPQKMSVMLKTSGGNITLRGVTGKHSVKSYAGNITITDAKGHIEAFTSGGNIDISNTRGTIFGHTNGGNILLDNNKGELRFRSNGGQIIAERISGTMISQVQGGDIKAQFLSISKGVSLETSAGNIFVELPHSKGYNINLVGSSIEFPTNLSFKGENNKRRVQGKLMEGGVPVSLSTDVGSVILRVKQ